MVRFSVVIPCRDGGLLAETHESLRAQTAPPDEIIVVDDVSAGLAAARNSGIARAKSEWVVLLDAGECLTPDALASCAAAIEREWQPDLWRLAPLASDELNPWLVLHADTSVAFRRARFPGDNESLLKLKQRWCPYFGISTEGGEVREALSQQTWQDVRIVDESALVVRRGDLAPYQAAPCRAVLLVRDDHAFARALCEDAFLLHKIHSALANRGAWPLWLVNHWRPRGAYPGAFLDEGADIRHANCVAVAIPFEAFLSQIPIPRGWDIWHDLAGVLAQQQPSGARVMIVGHAKKTDVLVALSRFMDARVEVSAPPPEPSVESPRSSSRLVAARLGVSRVLRSSLGATLHARITQNDTVRRFADRLAPVAVAPVAPVVEQPAALPIHRSGPVADDATPNHRRLLRNICGAQPFLPHPLDDGRTTVIIAAAAAELAPPGSVSAQLVRAIQSAAPATRIFLLATGPGSVAGAEYLLPAAASVFHVPPGDSTRQIVEILRQLGPATLIVSNSTETSDALRDNSALRTNYRIHYIDERSLGRGKAIEGAREANANRTLEDVVRLFERGMLGDEALQLTSHRR
jgi:hypothetical protein